MRRKLVIANEAHLGPKNIRVSLMMVPSLLANDLYEGLAWPWIWGNNLYQLTGQCGLLLQILVSSDAGEEKASVLKDPQPSPVCASTIPHPNQSFIFIWPFL